MKENKIKDKLIVIGFVGLLIVIFILNIVIKDKEISMTERRKLTQFPKITLNELMSGNTTQTLEKYTVDQFIGRDFFRSIKQFISFNILQQKDNNNMFIEADAIYKMDYPLSEVNVNKNVEKINKIYDKYLSNSNAYYVIIPDKNYYLENDEHLKIDYIKMKEIFNKNINSNIKYIDIWNDLKLDSYYRTDLHWKQEEILNVANTIKDNMSLQNKNTEYNKEYIGEYYGTYYGQLSSNASPDNIYVLRNATIDNCVTYNYEKKEYNKIYDYKSTQDKYDIYLSGATPIIEIINENSSTNKELLMFRDSFGSSLAPLLIDNYSKITLIDIRYISSSILENYIEFKNQDVIFIYSTLILNQNIFK